ncbi:type I glutamate--ammonia ligase, partial [Ralstonia insidiosa]|nr:type I glutamate--ammonia ligase [Ralstonia insidiosa]
NQNIYEMNREEREAVGIQDFPSTLYTALKAMRENKSIKNALGNHIYNQFINSKSIEWDYYRTQVSEWEREQYIKQY